MIKKIRKLLAFPFSKYVPETLTLFKHLLQYTRLKTYKIENETCLV